MLKVRPSSSYSSSENARRLLSMDCVSAMQVKPEPMRSRTSCIITSGKVYSRAILEHFGANESNPFAIGLRVCHNQYKLIVHPFLRVIRRLPTLRQRAPVRPLALPAPPELRQMSPLFRSFTCAAFGQPIAWAILAVCIVLPGVAEASPPGSRGYSDMVLADKPVAYWRFAEKNSVNSGEAGEALVGQVEGALVFGEAGPRGPTFPVFGTENLAAEFGDGGVTYIRVPDPGSESILDFENGDAITIEAWVRPEPFSGGGHYYILGKGRTHQTEAAHENHNYALRLTNKGGAAGLSFLFRSAGPKSAWHRWTSEPKVAIGDGWHYVAVTYTYGKPESLRGYVDGEPVAGTWDLGGATKQAPVVDDDELWIGSSMGGNPGSTFQGGLDEVALYRAALPAETIVARYEYVRPEVKVNLADIPEGPVQVDIYEGLPGGETWEFRPPQHTGQYQSRAFAFLDVPKKYNDRGIHVDRSNPFLIRAYGWITIPAGPQRFLVRCRNASRLYLDGELIAETKFHNISSSAHGDVFPYEATLSPHLRPLHRGDTETLAKLKGDGQRHLLRFEMIIGGQGHRPDFGETAVFLAPPGEDFRLVSDTLDVKLTNAEWMPFMANFRQWMIDLESQRRFAAGADARKYWEKRHEAARQYVLGQSAPEITKMDGSLPVQNEIDRFLAAGLKKSGVEPTPLTTDLAFLRRLTLDTIGVIPTEDQIKQYLGDPPDRRREMAIDRLLKHPGWADHWVGYWQDVLAENPNIINPTLNNTGPFRWWIYESFLDNKPMDRFATELLMMEGSARHGGPAGFGIATQNDAPMVAKARIACQAFLGMEMKCARCHDAPYRDFLQKDLFSTAALLKRGPQVVPASSSVGNPEEVESLFIEVTLAAGTKVQPQWPFDELIDSEELPASWLRRKTDKRERLALLITAPQNERFAKVIVNRLWKRYMGIGIVDPVDDWQAPNPNHPKLLTYLAQQLVISGYNLKHVARLIFESHAYQRRPFHGAVDGDFLYAGPRRRRMTPEQLVDSLFAGCGKTFDAGQMCIDIDGARSESSSLDLGRPRRAWMFASLSNERDRISLSLPFAQPFVTLLKAFGWRGARPNPTTPHAKPATVLEPAVLANGVIGQRFTRLSDDSTFTALALEEQPLTELIDRIFLRVYTRHPTDAEMQVYTELLAEGYKHRRTGKPPAPPRTLPRNKVSWSNQFDSRASQIKLELQTAVANGDPPSPQLAADWRKRMEDMLWSLMVSPEFLFIP